MKIICVLPTENYYIWQMLVQINNFKKFGYDKQTIYILGNTNKNFNKSMINEIDCGSSFYFFDDNRIGARYPSSLRPHVVSKFFKKYVDDTDLKSETWFYIDPDIVFTKTLDFNKYINDCVWYLSDTSSYIDSNYIKSKSKDLFYEMCAIVCVDPKTVENNDKNAGGAQYIMKNINSKFWEKVYTDCENLYILMTETSSKYHPEHPIQFWTADMWAVLWNAWYFNNETKIIKDLDFSWATDNIKRWNELSIFHNAGATPEMKKLFIKTNYQIHPFFKELTDVDKNSASYGYVREIKETENNFKTVIEKYF